MPNDFTSHEVANNLHQHRDGNEQQDNLSI